MILNEPVMVASVKKGADENVMRQDNWRCEMVVFKMSLLKELIQIATNLIIVPFGQFFNISWKDTKHIYDRKGQQQSA